MNTLKWVIRLNKVVSEFNIGKYKVLTLDEKRFEGVYDKYLIDGTEYKPVSVYDAPKCIAIESNDNFVGKTVEFISIL